MLGYYSKSGIFVGGFSDSGRDRVRVYVVILCGGRCHALPNITPTARILLVCGKRRPRHVDGGCLEINITRLVLPWGFKSDDHAHNRGRVRLLCRVDELWGCDVQPSEQQPGYEHLSNGWEAFAAGSKLKRGELLVFYRVGRGVYVVSVYNEEQCVRKVEPTENTGEAAGRITPSFYLPHNDQYTAQSVMILAGHLESCPQMKVIDKVQLENWAGQRWEVSIGHEHGHRYLARGWKKFREENDLRLGELVTFHQIGFERMRVAVFATDGWCKPPASRHSAMRIEAQPGGGSVEAAEPRRRWMLVRKMKPNFRRVRQDLARWFVKHNGLKCSRKVLLRNIWGSDWEVTMAAADNHVTPRYYIGQPRWSEFTIANDIESGDVLLFKCKGNNVIRVVALEDAEGEALLARAGRGGMLYMAQKWPRGEQ
ncbi:hypothetical protein C2S52_001158 [Perilla frutescens var. hirtella]|nr:hypothetical protein C2S52_001158 [Perilla frutescens var. hirtella]